MDLRRVVGVVESIADKIQHGIRGDDFQLGIDAGADVWLPVDQLDGQHVAARLKEVMNPAQRIGNAGGRGGRRRSGLGCRGVGVVVGGDGEVVGLLVGVDEVSRWTGVGAGDFAAIQPGDEAIIEPDFKLELPLIAHLRGSQAQHTAEVEIRRAVLHQGGHIRPQAGGSAKPKRGGPGEPAGLGEPDVPQKRPAARAHPPQGIRQGEAFVGGGGNFIEPHLSRRGGGDQGQGKG